MACPSTDEESVADEATGGAFPLRVAVKGVTVDISALETDQIRSRSGGMIPPIYHGNSHMSYGQYSWLITINRG
jgi:hypothetical protein